MSGRSTAQGGPYSIHTNEVKPGQTVVVDTEEGAAVRLTRDGDGLCVDNRSLPKSVRRYARGGKTTGRLTRGVTLRLKTRKGSVVVGNIASIAVEAAPKEG